MPTIVSLAGKLIRINFDSNRIELSKDRGRTWIYRFSGSFYGKFIELVAFGDEIFALTERADRNDPRRSYLCIQRQRHQLG